MLEELKSYLNKRDYACNRAIKFYQQGNLLASQLWKRVSNYYAWKAEEIGRAHV